MGAIRDQGAIFAFSLSKSATVGAVGTVGVVFVDDGTEVIRYALTDAPGRAGTAGSEPVKGLIATV